MLLLFAKKTPPKLIAEMFSFKQFIYVRINNRPTCDLCIFVNLDKLV